jgi:hypothetical protein
MQRAIYLALHVRRLAQLSSLLLSLVEAKPE